MAGGAIVNLLFVTTSSMSSRFIHSPFIVYDGGLSWDKYNMNMNVMTDFPLKPKLRMCGHFYLVWFAFSIKCWNSAMILHLPYTGILLTSGMTSDRNTGIYSFSSWQRLLVPQFGAGATIPTLSEDVKPMLCIRLLHCSVFQNVTFTKYIRIAQRVC
jgi:hypothetical protein